MTLEELSTSITTYLFLQSKLFYTMERIKLDDRKAIVQTWCAGKCSLQKIANMYNCSKTAVFKIITKFGQHHTLEDLPKSKRRSGPAKGKNHAVVKYAKPSIGS